MREHIRAILCNSDAEAFEWVLNWLARAVQQPDCPGEVALVLCGGRGAGKGMFARAVASLFGQHARQISQARHLTGNFNAHLADCVLLFVDEAFWAGDKQGESVLKSIITEPTLAIEKKGLDVVMVPNMLDVIMASNNTWVVPAGLDERRFLVLAVNSSTRKQV
jgi:phage/plasmid-associated DNA primase